MAYRLIYYAKVIIQVTILDLLGIPQAREEIDLRTLEGRKRYKQLFGNAPCMGRAEPPPGGKGDPPSKKTTPALDFVLSATDERSRRLFAGYLATTSGRGGVQKVAGQAGLDPKTVRKGKSEIASRAQCPNGRARKPGGGRPPKMQADPAYRQEIQEIIDNDLAGDPMGKKPNWVRKTLRWIKTKMQGKGITASPSTIRKTFKILEISLKKNKKREAAKVHPDREAQFQQINTLKQQFLAEGNPFISADTKKKERVGNFKNDGRTWRKVACEVLDHDFPSAALGKLVPFGVYDLQANHAYIYCGVSAETAEFAVECIVRWWAKVGQKKYPGRTHLLVFCDCGGGNGYRLRKWKADLQAKLADRFGLTVTVCHYPPGASKYNPIEHQVFNIISENWAGEPLISYEKALGYIRSTKTEQGLKVDAVLVEKAYQKGLKVTDEEMEALNIEHAQVCPNWNYTIKPHESPSSSLPKEE